MYSLGASGYVRMMFFVYIRVVVCVIIKFFKVNFILFNEKIVREINVDKYLL